MSSAAGGPKKKAKRDHGVDGTGEEDGPKLEDLPSSEQSQRALFAKPVFAKRPWYVGGKVAYSGGSGPASSVVYTIFQGGLAVVNVRSQHIQQVLAEGDEVVSFAVEEQASSFSEEEVAMAATTVCTVSRKGLVRVFERHQPVRQFACLHTQQVTEMALDGDLLASGGMDAVVKVYSVSGGYVTHNLRGHVGPVTALAFSPCAKSSDVPRLASADSSGAICIWDLTKTTPHVWFKGTHLSVVPALAFTQDFLISVGRDRVFSVWDWKTEKLVKTVPTVNESLEAVLALGGGSSNNNNNEFVIAGAQGTLRRFTVDTKKQQAPVVRELSNIDLGHGDGVAFLAKRGQHEIVAVSQVELIFSYHKRLALEQEARGKQCGFDDEILDCCFVQAAAAAGGGSAAHTIAVCSNSPLLRLYDFNGGGGEQEDGASSSSSCANLRLLRGHTGSVLTAASNSPNLLVTGSKDNTLRVWTRNAHDDEGGEFECSAVLQGHAESVSTVALGVHHAAIVSGADDGSIRLWDQTAGSKYALLDSHVAAHSKAVLDVSFAPTKEELLGSCSADKTGKIWQLVRRQDGGQLRLVKKCDLVGHRRQVNSIRLSAVDRVCVTASSDLTVRVWSVDTGMCVRTLEGHTGAVSRALIMRNGHSIFSTGADGTVKTWDLKTSACGQTLFGKRDGGHEDRIWSAALKPSASSSSEEDGGDEADELVCTVGVEGALTVWHDAHAEETARKNAEIKEGRDNKDELDRSLREKRYVEAARLALKLDRPNQLRQILQTDPTVLPAVLKQCTNEELGLLLTCVLQWNTVGRTCLVAQRALHEILDLDRVELETRVGSAPLSRFLKAMMPYTERHFNRIDRLVKTSFLIDRVLESTGSI